MTRGTTPRRTRPARVVVAATCLVAVLGAGAATWALLDLPTSSQAAETDTGSTTTGTATTTGTPTSIGTVTKGDLVASTTIAGTLGYGTPVALPGAAAGTITWLPKPGQVVHRDEPLYAVDERPVRAMHGTTPLWRPLVTGTTGADVQQLNENLAALGYDVAQDDAFGRRTLAAVRRWQADRGLPVTGRITADQIAFVDGDVRVAAVTGQLGRPAQGETEVLQITSTERVVTATVAQRDAEQVAVGTTVEVVVNGAGGALPGEVVDAVPTESDDGSQDVAVTVAFDAGDRTLPSAGSAQVIARSETEHDVLSVPVSALVVTGDGDGHYAVDVLRGSGETRRVRVEVGFVADGRAQVTGDVHEGDEVVVPS
ncbi:peptidoglycan hydrolase-like protein with peptidoglycan-binding domain [Curtobacterium flaccumfaciens]|uniref:Peptidoglycan hydrolase-like protein with peptidoglycan-binding domain n=1 Tax=Curtobacterium salicis TaxID=1779862 RepID=A0ABX0T8Z2_9MICO|nr:peptidoglycan-binding protein [Curtobacterium sp. WW7]NII40911.1 peptidoglycan hydrolase-like protein with peptidoglycan-binding domain [Curtobacterium sp. WW7]